MIVFCLPPQENWHRLSDMKKEINADFLKCVALVTMTLDHMAQAEILPIWVHWTIGRLAFPIFACLLTYHLQTKQLFTKYAGRLLFWGMVTAFVRPENIRYGIFLAFLWPLLAIWGFQKLQNLRLSEFVQNALMEVLFCLGAWASCYTSYELWGFIYICLWYYWWQTRNKYCGAGLVLFGGVINYTVTAFLSPAISAITTTGLANIRPSGRRWFKFSYLFYPYFPLHCWLLWCWQHQTFYIPHFPWFMWLWGSVYFLLWVRKKLRRKTTLTKAV